MVLNFIKKSSNAERMISLKFTYHESFRCLKHIHTSKDAEIAKIDFLSHDPRLVNLSQMLQTKCFIQRHEDGIQCVNYNNHMTPGEMTGYIRLLLLVNTKPLGWNRIQCEARDA